MAYNHRQYFRDQSLDSKYLFKFLPILHINIQAYIANLKLWLKTPPKPITYNSRMKYLVASHGSEVEPCLNKLVEDLKSKQLIITSYPMLSQTCLLYIDISRNFYNAASIYRSLNSLYLLQTEAGKDKKHAATKIIELIENIVFSSANPSKHTIGLRRFNKLCSNKKMKRIDCRNAELLISNLLELLQQLIKQFDLKESIHHELRVLQVFLMVTENGSLVRQFMKGQLGGR